MGNKHQVMGKISWTENTKWRATNANWFLLL